MAGLEDFQNLAIATAIGFLIGFQREWRDAEERKSNSFAGARTFALTGLAGGLAAVVGGGGLAVIAVGLAALGALVIAAYWAEARNAPGSGGTTEIALFGAYLLGALAGQGQPALAAAAGVLVAILLALKPAVQRAARAMDEREIGAALRFLAISVIVLPILPNEGYGPYEALNPQRIWRLVVLISGLSFLGYWLARLFGSRGLLLTGMVGGLASSTAATLSLSRLVKAGAAAPRPAAAGIVAANLVMLFRVALLLSAVSLGVLSAIWPTLVVSALVGGGAVLLLWRGAKAEGGAVALENPLELKPALFFAALLAAISVLSRFASDRFGDAGLYVVASLTGLADVDAITLTAGGQADRAGIAPETAAAAILIAIASNIVIKAGLAFFIAGPAAGLRVAVAFAILLAAGGVAAGLTLLV